MMGEKSGCGLMGLVLVVLLLVAAGLAALWPALQEQREDARAQRIYAQAQLESTREEMFERRFVMWTTALAASADRAQGLLLGLSGLCGALTAVVLIRWLEGRSRLPRPGTPTGCVNRRLTHER